MRNVLFYTNTILVDIPLPIFFGLWAWSMVFWTLEPFDKKLKRLENSSKEKSVSNVLFTLETCLTFCWMSLFLFFFRNIRLRMCEKLSMSTV